MKKQKPVLAIIYCPTCRTGIELYELPDIGEEFEVKCPKCKDVIRTKFEIANGK